MSYCPKCGNKIEDTMTFCPICGAPLKDAPSPVQPTPPSQTIRNEKQEKNEKHDSREKQEKSESGFIGYLIGGLILITFGAFSILQLSGYFADSGQSWALMLLLIGVIIIIGAVYVALTARRHSPRPT
jgi:uncharacterized Zn finger protein (UPF0148 family)